MPPKEDFPALRRPMAVFDAGIGSYAAVTAIQRRLPRQDILYFADRASFPYGGKSRLELLAILRRTLRFVQGFAPAAVLVASNAPSITVLDELMGTIEAPVFGVRPPVRAALAAAGDGDVAVLGVRSMVESTELRQFADREAQGKSARVHLVNASPLVDLVESGAFLLSPDDTQRQVSEFLDALDAQHPQLAALTLSSTHLPWLRHCFETARPGQRLFDPLEDALGVLAPHAVHGTGTVLALATGDDRYTLTDFQQMLDRLGVALSVRAVRVSESGPND